MLRFVVDLNARASLSSVNKKTRRKMSLLSLKISASIAKKIKVQMIGEMRETIIGEDLLSKII